MDEDRVKVDCIVVGAGPAGLTAAYIMAQAGLEVIVVERGEYAGSKNVSGVLYSTVLSEIIPDFADRAPLERPIVKRKIGYLGEETSGAVEFGAAEWAKPPHNQSWVVYRAKFDRWFAEQAEEAGANIVDGMVVDDLEYEGQGDAKRVVGVRIRDEEEPFFADAVILAEGAQGIVTQRAAEALGLKKGLKKQAFGIGVKEIWGLSAQVIEDRFNLGPGEGAAYEYIGSPFKGLTGGGFLYTGEESLALGYIIKIESMKARGVSPHEVMEAYKAHPDVGRLLLGGELLEYSAHIIPEGGLDALGELSHNGLLISGDAAGLVNASAYHEGANLAMESGRLAAKAVIRARESGDFSKAGLASYEDALQKSFVMEDLRTFRNVPSAQEVFPRVMETVPGRVFQFLADVYGQSDEPKKAVRKRAIKRFFRGLPKLQTLKDLWRMKGMVG